MNTIWKYWNNFRKPFEKFNDLFYEWETIWRTCQHYYSEYAVSHSVADSEFIDKLIEIHDS